MVEEGERDSRALPDFDLLLVGEGHESCSDMRPFSLFISNRLLRFSKAPKVEALSEEALILRLFHELASQDPIVVDLDLVVCLDLGEFVGIGEFKALG